MFIENMNEIDCRPTEFLLKAISQRLSGRDDCKKQIYTVTINHIGITMDPLVEVYPDKHHRKDADKMNIVQYVHHYKMSRVTLDQLIFGVYEYQLSANGKQRRWRRIK